MAVYTFTGQGTQTISGGTQHLEIDVLAFQAGASFGEAFPANYYHLGFIRMGRGAYYYPPQPIEGLHVVMDVQSFNDNFAYGLRPGTQIQVTEARN